MVVGGGNGFEYDSFVCELGEDSLISLVTGGHVNPQSRRLRHQSPRYRGRRRAGAIGLVGGNLGRGTRREGIMRTKGIMVEDMWGQDGMPNMNTLKHRGEEAEAEADYLE